jgi:hypothetical protein
MMHGNMNVKLTTLVRFNANSVRAYCNPRLQEADIHQHEFLRILVMPSAGLQTKIFTITPSFFVEGTFYVLSFMGWQTEVAFRATTSMRLDSVCCRKGVGNTTARASS